LIVNGVFDGNFDGIGGENDQEANDGEGEGFGGFFVGFFVAGGGNVLKPAEDNKDNGNEAGDTQGVIDDGHYQVDSIVKR